MFETIRELKDTYPNIIGVRNQERPFLISNPCHPKCTKINQCFNKYSSRESDLQYCFLMNFMINKTCHGAEFFR